LFRDGTKIVSTIVIGIHISRQVQINNYLRSTTDIANQFLCRQFTFSDLRKIYNSSFKITRYLQPDFGQLQHTESIKNTFMCWGVLGFRQQ